MKNTLLIAALVLNCLGSMAYAQENDGKASPNADSTASANDGAGVEQPRNQLGITAPEPDYSDMPIDIFESDSPLEVVIPARQDVVEKSVRDLEDVELTPEQWDRVKRIQLSRMAELSSPYAEPPKPVTRTLMMNLDAGAPPSVVRLASPLFSSLTFSDLNGNPWFIESVSLNRDLFSDSASLPSGGSSAEVIPTHVLSVQPKLPMAYGNVIVKLRGLNTPISLMFTSGQKEVDVRVDVKVPGSNPNAMQAMQVKTLPDMDHVIGLFLDGVPPAAASRLKINGTHDAEAWRYDDKLYVRIRADAQYPAYIGRASNTNGLSVYRYPNVPSSATFSKNGQAFTVFFDN